MVEHHSEGERAKALVARLREGLPSSAEMFATFRQLDALSPEVVTAALADWMGPLPSIDTLDAERRRSLRLPPRALRLTRIAEARDADILDLGPVAEEQVRLTGLSWDGSDLPIEERLDGEIEGTFAGTLQHIVFADAEDPERKPLFDVVLHDEGIGVAFAAGTSRQVALLADGNVETLDKRVREALEVALTRSAVELPSAPASKSAKKSVQKRATKTLAPKKKVSKAAATKKPAAKKTATAKPRQKAAATKKKSKPRS